MRGFLRPVIQVAAVLAALLAAGCGGGGDKPFALPSRTSTPPVATASQSGSPDPSASVSVSPSTQAQQVEQAVRNYFAVANEATRTGNTAPLAALSVPTCGCRQLVRYIDGEYHKGHIEGSTVSVVSIDPVELRTRLAATNVTFHVDAARTVGPDGKIISTATAGSATDRMILVENENDQWIVSDVVNVKMTTDQ